MKIPVIILSATLLVLLLSLPACKKDNSPKLGIVSGTVTDATTNAAIEGVTMTIAPTDSTFVSLADGSYSFSGLNIDQYTITAEKTAYATTEKTISVNLGDNLTLDFMLEPFTLVLNSTSFGFGSTQQYDTLLLSSLSDAPLVWSIENDADWVVLGATGGTITAGETDTVPIYINRQAVQQGSHETYLTVVSDGGTQAVHISADKFGGYLVATPTSLNFGSEADTKTLELYNDGDGTVIYSVSFSETWLSGTPSGGSIPFDNSHTITVTANRAALGTGTYNATVTIESNANEITIPVTIDNAEPSSTPGVVTGTVSQIEPTTALAAGTVTDIGTGASFVSEHGHCWSSDNSYPTLSDSKTQLGSMAEPDDFTSNLTNLQPGTTYFVRAYATNVNGTAYGNPTQFMTPTTNQWNVLPAFGGTAREGAVGFSINGKGYVCSGYNGSYTNDLWEYNPENNTWTQKADLPGDERAFAVGFAIEEKGYVATGKNATENLNDLWEYSPTSNTWTSKVNFPGNARFGAVAFVLNGKGYIGTGMAGSSKKDFFCYTPSTNTWNASASLPGNARLDAAVFVLNARAYLVGGRSGSYAYEDFWEYSEQTNSWNQRSDFSGGTRHGAVGFTLGNYGYIATGRVNSVSKDDLWQFNLQTGSWSQKAVYGGLPRYYATGIVIGSRAYIGLGRIGSSSYANDFWEYIPE